MRKLALAVLLPGALVAGCSRRPANEPAKRDLTLLADVDSSNLGVVSPRELWRSNPEPQTPVAATTAVRPRLVPVHKHAKPAAPTPAHRTAPVAAPDASPTPQGPPTPPPVAPPPRPGRRPRRAPPPGGPPDAPAGGHGAQGSRDAARPGPVRDSDADGD